MYKDIREIIDMITTGNSTIWIVISTLIIIWLFREVRVRYINLSDSKISRIEKTLEVYGNLEYIVMQLIKDHHVDASGGVEQLQKAMSHSYSYLSRDLFKKWESIRDNLSIENLSFFDESLKKEISMLNYEQSTRLDINNEDLIGNYVNSVKPIFIPLVVTFITVLFLMGVSYVSYYVLETNNEWYKKIDVVFILFSIFPFIFLLYLLMEMALDKKLIYSFPNILLLSISFLGFPTLFFIKYTSFAYLPWITYFIFFQATKMYSKEAIK